MEFAKQNWVWFVLLAALLTIRFLLPSGTAVDDAQLEQMMQDGKSAEALAWTKEADGTDELRTIHELNNEQSLEIIQRLYDLGAVCVTAVDIESDPDFGETTNILIVELPDDTPLRKQLFKYESKQARSVGFNGVTDTGQKYLFFYWT
jgi:hypothetical protein